MGGGRTAERIGGEFLMATIDYLVTDTELSDIADAIRAKGGTSAQLQFPSGFTTAIAAIPTGTTPTGTISISANGTYDVTNYAAANVNVSSGGGTTAVTFMPAQPTGGAYNIGYVDPDGNVVTTDYYTLDPQYSGTATVNVRSGSPIGVVIVGDPFETIIPTPTNTETVLSRSGNAGSRPALYYFFATYMAN